MLTGSNTVANVNKAMLLTTEMTFALSALGLLVIFASYVLLLNSQSESSLFSSNSHY